MEKENNYESLKAEHVSVYDKINQEEKEEMQDLCSEYTGFLNSCKTERKCVLEAIKLAEAEGFVRYEKGMKLKSGDRVYFVNRCKNIMLATVGKRAVSEGINIIGSHIDAPRLDLKQNPLYESNDTALLKTHYYGGIKKYQWTAIPLAIHGVVYLKNGDAVEISIGDNDGDPIFCITDLLPHLAKDQMVKTLAEGIDGEALNVLVGGIPVPETNESGRFKLGVLSLLNSAYGITESDFRTAELEVVPAFKAGDVGFDRSFVGGYGQDDRVCAFTSMKAIFESKNPEKTALCLFADKEEVGSSGNTGAQSRFTDMCIAELLAATGENADLLTYHRTLAASSYLSADVAAAVDPHYDSVMDKRNAPFAGRGVAVMKYSGARGKAGASDASAELLSRVCRILDSDGVVWQTAELGKVDQGGGGTIAEYISTLNIDVLDCGVPVLSMHSPFELTAKADIYMAYRAYKAFYKAN